MVQFFCEELNFIEKVLIYRFCRGAVFAPVYLHVNQTLSSKAKSPPLSFSSVAKNLGGGFAKDL